MYIISKSAFNEFVNTSKVKTSQSEFKWENSSLRIKLKELNEDTFSSISHLFLLRVFEFYSMEDSPVQQTLSDQTSSSSNFRVSEGRRISYPQWACLCPILKGKRWSLKTSLQDMSLRRYWLEASLPSFLGIKRSNIFFACKGQILLIVSRSSSLAWFISSAVMPY